MVLPIDRRHSTRRNSDSNFRFSEQEDFSRAKCHKSRTMKVPPFALKKFCGTRLQGPSDLEWLRYRSVCARRSGVL